MTTSTIERTTQSTCANCPYFQDFGESNGRGWCSAFDQMARQQHEQTGDCEQEIKALEKESQQQTVPEPEPPQPAGLAGDAVSNQLSQLRQNSSKDVSTDSKTQGQGFTLFI